ncbi:MAG: hypothetical protein C0483_11460 [Pirellula sp.]|nr:hypothetical protein [Pirellula sp.]
MTRRLMPSIFSTTIDEIAGKLPPLALLGSDTAKMQGPVSLLVTSAGFEERACAIANDIESESIQRAVRITYPTNIHDNASIDEQLGRQLGAVPLPYVRGRLFNDVRQLVESLEADARIVVDLSPAVEAQLFRGLDRILRAPALGERYRDERLGVRGHLPVTPRAEHAAHECETDCPTWKIDRCRRVRRLSTAVGSLLMKSFGHSFVNRT